jgi:hypothetical protein
MLGFIRKILSRCKRNSPEAEVEYVKTRYGELSVPRFSEDEEAYLLREYGIDAKKLKFGRGYRV